MTLQLKSIRVGDTSAGFTCYWIDTEILTITQQHLLPRLAALRPPSLQQVGHRPLDHHHFFFSLPPQFCQLNWHALADRQSTVNGEQHCLHGALWPNPNIRLPGLWWRSRHDALLNQVLGCEQGEIKNVLWDQTWDFLDQLISADIKFSSVWNYFRRQ